MGIYLFVTAILSFILFGLLPTVWAWGAVAFLWLLFLTVIFVAITRDTRGTE